MRGSVLQFSQGRSLRPVNSRGMKRGMGSGFAGIENELFYNPRTSMLFGDAKASLGKLVTELKALA